MRKKLLGLLIMVCISLSGCTTEYTKKDIAVLVKKECNVRQFTVSDAPVDMKGEDGYTDRLWTVRLNDGSGLVFHVLDDFYWGMESTANYLRTDYNEVLLKQLADGYGFKNIKVKSGRENVLVFTTLTGTFSNREELETLFRELYGFQEYLADNGKSVDIRVDFQFMNPLRETTSYTMDHGDFVSTISKDESTGEYTRELDRAREIYLVTCLDYRFEDHISEFSKEEIASIAAQSGFRIGISRDGGNTYEFYDDLCCNLRYYGISFGALYEILAREGFEVTGNSRHYSFVGADGSLYEISYDFCDYSYEGRNTDKTQNGYYYLKDGVKTSMQSYFHTHFTTYEIEEMTGLLLEQEMMIK